MANPEHLKILKQGVEVWNKWRMENPKIEQPDKSRFVEVDLSEVNLTKENLGESAFSEVNLRKRPQYGEL